MAAAIFLGTYFETVFEPVVEMTLIAEARLVSDLGHGKLGVPQELCRPGKSQLDNVLGKRGTRGALEELFEPRLAHADHRRRLGHLKFLRVMLVEEIEQPLQPLHALPLLGVIGTDGTLQLEMLPQTVQDLQKMQFARRLFVLRRIDAVIGLHQFPNGGVDARSERVVRPQDGQRRIRALIEGRKKRGVTLTGTDPVNEFRHEEDHERFMIAAQIHHPVHLLIVHQQQIAGGELHDLIAELESAGTGDRQDHLQMLVPVQPVGEW